MKGAQLHSASKIVQQAYSSSEQASQSPCLNPVAEVLSYNGVDTPAAKVYTWYTLPELYRSLL